MYSPPCKRADGGSLASRTIVAKGGLFGRIHHRGNGAESLCERRSTSSLKLEPLHRSFQNRYCGLLVTNAFRKEYEYDLDTDKEGKV